MDNEKHTFKIISDTSEEPTVTIETSGIDVKDALTHIVMIEACLLKLVPCQTLKAVLDECERSDDKLIDAIK